MVSVNHPLEIAYRSLPDRTEIDMYKHEERDNKTDNNMKKICKMKSADSKKIGRNHIGIQQSQSGNCNYRNQDIHCHHVGELLQRVEFYLFCDGKRS